MRIEFYIYVDIIYFGPFVTQKTAIGVLIWPAAKVITIKIVAPESLIIEIVDVNRDNMYEEIASMR